MTTLAASGYPSNAARTNAEMKVVLDAFRDILAEHLGGEAKSELTIATGAIVPPAGAGGGVHTVDTQGNAATDDLDTVTTTNTPEGRLIMLRAENASRVVTLTHAAGGAGQMLLTDSTDFVLDALDKWILLHRESTDWVEVARNYGVDNVSARAYLGVPRSLGDNILCAHERLRVEYGTVATVTIAADAVLLTDTSGNQQRFASTNETLTISGTGAGGRDVTENSGAEKASDWYHIWLIGKTDGTVDAFATLACFPGGSSIYSVLPSGYTLAGYVGAAYNNGSSNFTDFWQRDDFVHFGYTSLVASGVQTSRTSLSMTTAVPDTAKAAMLNAGLTPASSGTTATATLSPDASSATGEFALQITPASAAQSWLSAEVCMRVAQTMAYRVSTGDSLDLGVVGFRF